jgi:hypothetical protein
MVTDGHGAAADAYVSSGVPLLRTVRTTTYGTRKHVHARHKIFSTVQEKSSSARSKIK